MEFFHFWVSFPTCRLVVGRCEPTLLEHSVTVSTRGFDPRIHGSNPCAPASREGKHVNTLSSNRDKPPKTIPKYKEQPWAWSTALRFQGGVMAYNQDFLDAVSLVSFIIGIANYNENLSQSDKDDMMHALDEKANVMLERLEADLEEQNELLRQILDKLR